MQSSLDPSVRQTIQALLDNVLRPLKQSFIGKDEIIDLMGVCLLARENLFLLGPPGTAKSALVQSLARRIDGKVFDYLLTRFTEPNELFGPFDIRKLREGELVTNSEGMLPEADFVFLDELLNANSAILNSLLMALNERVFRRGRETRKLSTLMFVGASNRLPEDEALRALFDRFLLRVPCENVPDASLGELLKAGWLLEMSTNESIPTISVQSLALAQQNVTRMDLSLIAEAYAETIRRIRRAGFELSDRRVVRLQRTIAASAMLCNRSHANTTDLWVLKYIWDVQEQRPVLASIVEAVLGQASDDEKSTAHPLSSNQAIPKAEEIVASLSKLQERIAKQAEDRNEANPIEVDERHEAIREQLSSLANRCQWIPNELQRQQLVQKIDLLWKALTV